MALFFILFQSFVHSICLITEHSIGLDGNSVMKVNVEGHAPRLHYVHPTCFEAGKPIELVVCGSNLLQPKFQ
jgi:hypothetical protein